MNPRSVIIASALLFMLISVARGDPPAITPSTESVTVTTSGTIAFPAGRQLVQTFTAATRAAAVPVSVGQVGWETDSGIFYRATGAGAGAWTAIAGGGGGGGTWGSITGTLSSQTDLQNALNAKLATNGNASALTALNASALASGTIPDARFPATLPALNGSALTALNASTAFGTGAVPVAFGGTGLSSLGDLADSLAVPQPAGAWAEPVAYTSGDLVTRGGAAWLCILSHSSSPDDEPGTGVNQATYWAAFGASGGAVSDGDKGDVIVSGGGGSWVLDGAIKSEGGLDAADAGKLAVFDASGSLTATARVRARGPGLSSQFYSDLAYDKLVLGERSGPFPSNSVTLQTSGAGLTADRILLPPDLDGTILVSGSSISASWITSGTLDGARMPVVMPARDGNALFNLDAANIVGTLDANRLPLSSVTPGTYTNPTIIVDSKGRVTSASSGSASSPAGAGSELQIRADATTFAAVTGSSSSNGGIILAPSSGSALTLNGGTVSASAPLITGTQTWNAGAVTMHLDTLNLINTASGSGSTIFRRQVGGADRFKVSVGGDLTAGDGADAKLSLVGGVTTNFISGTGGLSIDQSLTLTNRSFITAADPGVIRFLARNYAGSVTQFALCEDGTSTANTLQLGPDHATTPSTQTIKAHDVTTGTGAALDLRGGNGSAAGGAVTISTSATTTPAVRVTVKASGVVNVASMPTSSAGLVSGDLWNDAGTVKIVP